MEKIVVRGGKPLFGSVKIQGSKNAALPLIFASVAIKGTSVIDNVPDIGDVRHALSIVEAFGAGVERCGARVIIHANDLVYKTPSCELVSKIRASTYLIGACLSRFGIAELMSFGGCNFGNRPIDIHIASALRLGAEQKGDVLYAKKLSGCEIQLTKPSVGATINTLIMASGASGTTVIKGAAKEPHVTSLICFLRSAGADIIEDNGKITVTGRELSGGSATVIPDMIEAGTYLLLSPLLSGCVRVDFESPKPLAAYLGALCAGGINAFSCGTEIFLEGGLFRPIEITTGPYPKFPTDLQPQMAPLMAKFFGGALVETVWPDRFNYLNSLYPFGIRYEREGNRARIFRSSFKRCETVATDLRGGAACLLTALATEGESVIYNPDILLRGYSALCGNLTSLGADIKII